MRKTITCLSFLCVAIAVPASASVLYSNGPVLGTVDARNITDFQVTDSFTLSSSSTITGFVFASWNTPGGVTTGVDWAIGSGSFGNDLGSGTAAVSNTFLFSNPFGADVFSNTVSGLNLALGAGTYWLTLLNAVDSTRNPVYWDENDGPSLAFQDQGIGAVGSETFDIVGDAATSIPEPGSLSLLGAGIVAAMAIRRRSRA